VPGLATSAPPANATDWQSLALHKLRMAEQANPADPALWRACALDAARAGALQISERACRELAPQASDPADDRRELLSLLAAGGLGSARNHEWARVERWAQLLDRYGGAEGARLPEAQFLAGLLRENAGDRQGALAAMAAATAGGRVSLERCLAWSNELRYHHQFAVAERLLDLALAQHGARPSLLVRQAAVLAELDRLEEAHQRWAAVLAHDPQQPDARLLFATSSGAGHRPPTPIPDDLYDLPATTGADAVTRALVTCGVAVVRGALDRRIASQWRERLVGNLDAVYYPMFPQRGRGEGVGVPVHFLAAASERPRLEELCQGLRDQPVPAWHWTLDGRIDIADVWSQVMALEAVTAGARGYLGERFRAPPQLGYARRKSGGQPSWLPLHQDARTGYWDHPALAIWVALSDCGAEAPSLDLVPYRLDHLFPVCLYDDEQLRRRRYQRYHSSVRDDLLPPGFIKTLVLEPGDVVLFTSMVLHRTQQLDRPGVRFNLDVRFESLQEWLP
jgi:hypothetical protein